jgi:hypothetical protein
MSRTTAYACARTFFGEKARIFADHDMAPRPAVISVAVLPAGQIPRGCLLASRLGGSHQLVYLAHRVLGRGSRA